MLGKKPLSPSQESSALEGVVEKLKPIPLHSIDSTRGNPEGTSEPGITQQGGAGQMPHLGLPALASDTSCQAWLPPPLSGSGS